MQKKLTLKIKKVLLNKNKMCALINNLISRAINDENNKK